MVVDLVVALAVAVAAAAAAAAAQSKQVVVVAVASFVVAEIVAGPEPFQKTKVKLKLS